MTKLSNCCGAKIIETCGGEPHDGATWWHECTQCYALPETIKEMIVTECDKFLDNYDKHIAYNAAAPMEYIAKKAYKRGYYDGLKYAKTNLANVIAEEVEKTREETQEKACSILRTWHISKGGFTEIEEQIRNLK